MSREEALTGNNYCNWLDLILPEDREYAEKKIRQVTSGERATFEYRIRRPVDGAIRVMHNTDFPILGDDGKVELIGGVGHDITELRQSESRFKTLVEGVPQLVWRAVDHGKWTWASPQWTEFTGQSSEDSEGLGWLDCVHPNDRERTMEIWNGAIERGEFSAEYRLCHAGHQNYRWFQTRATPVRDSRGMIIEWLGTSTDVEELRSMQERQKILVGELQHRTRNLMAVVQAVALQTGRESRDGTEFLKQFTDRLTALARIQGLLSRLDSHDRVTFDELIESEFWAIGDRSGKVALDGPKGVQLRSATVQTLAMALHELATNSLKYGALKDDFARLSVRWRIDPDEGTGEPWLHIDWTETGIGNPAFAERAQGRGHGRELIENALPYQLGAKTNFRFTPDGLHCTIAMPVPGID